MKRLVLIFSALMLIALLAAVWHSSLQPRPVVLTPTLTGEQEYCLTCHADLPEISSSHPVETFGCVICHGGERLALEADLAHSSLRGGRNPSRLEVVEASCGGSLCHSGEGLAERHHIPRLLTSLHATYAGAIASVRCAAGEQPSLEASLGAVSAADNDGKSQTGILILSAFDPARAASPEVQTFAQDCLYCHLSAQPLPGEAFARLEGCAACHTPTANHDLRPLKEKGNQNGIHHLTVAISYTQCNTCHNRGEYDLSSLSFQPRQDQSSDIYPPGTQFARCEWTLDCIDCHTRLESMGDGDLHSSQAEFQYVQCRTCHGTLTQLPRTRVLSTKDEVAYRLAFLNPVIEVAPGDTILVTDKGELLWTIRQLQGGEFELFGKASGQRFIFQPVKGSDCQQNPDQQQASDCHACHATQH
ncbi:MAG: hypothetical protein JXB15_05320 [Anaerolineales bacterium]|nr:hypothetical protein [Anaerolineales bacterium]